jgi:DNA-binding NarL/FixJ family response regulator
VSVLIMAKDPILRAGVERQLVGMPGVVLLDPACGRHPEVALVVADSIDDEVLGLVRRVRRLSLSRIVVVASVIGATAARATEAGATTIIPRAAADYQRLAWAVQTKIGDRPPVAVLSDPERQCLLPDTTRLVADDRSGSGVSERDRYVLRLLAEGADTGEIARQLAYSEPTIKNAIQRLFEQLKAKNRPHLVALAIRNGII